MPASRPSGCIHRRLDFQAVATRLDGDGIALAHPTIDNEPPPALSPRRPRMLPLNDHETVEPGVDASLDPQEIILACLMHGDELSAG